MPDPYCQIGTIDLSYGRISAAGVSNGKYGEIGLVYGWDKKPYRFKGNETETNFKQLHAQWAIEKFETIAQNKTAKLFLWVSVL